MAADSPVTTLEQKLESLIASHSLLVTEVRRMNAEMKARFVVLDDLERRVGVRLPSLDDPS